MYVHGPHQDLPTSSLYLSSYKTRSYLTSISFPFYAGLKQQIELFWLQISVW